MISYLTPLALLAALAPHPAGAQREAGDQEIVVMSDTGDVWQGAAAWVMCLWALEEYRAWSARLATPSMQAIARTVVHWISSHRIGLSRLMGFKSDADLQEAARSAVITSATTCTLRHDLDLLD